jgi:antitoxin component HigA of HigAB toxin-antitoxin module
MIMDDYMDAKGMTDKQFAAGIGRSDSWVSVVRSRGSMATNDIDAINAKYGIDISKGSRQKVSSNNGIPNANTPIDVDKLEYAVKMSGLSKTDFEKTLGYNSHGWVSKRMESKRCTMQEILLIKSLYGVDIKAEPEKNEVKTDKLEKKIDEMQKSINDLVDLILSQYGELEAKLDEIYKKETVQEKEGEK